MPRSFHPPALGAAPAPHVRNRREKPGADFGFLLLALVASVFAWSGCRKADVPTALPAAPSVRLYFMSSVAGALEPCGCRKDMLGGVDHAAALLAAEAKVAPHRLLLATGPLLFQDPELAVERRQQDLWKAEALAGSLADLELEAWAPGVNDFALGAGTLKELLERTGARLVAANLPPSGLPVVDSAVFDVGKYRVGVAGIGAIPPAAGTPDDSVRALTEAAQQLIAAGAQIRVALIASARGDGLRLVEKVEGFDVAALGKASDEGDANDAPFPPTLVGETLVVQAPNHLQALAYVDLFVVGDSFSFVDEADIVLSERIESVSRQLAELNQRHQRYVAGEKAEPAQARAIATEIDRLKAVANDLSQQKATRPKPKGSYFRSNLVSVRESAGLDPKVASRMSEYYRRVNEHNREAFKDRKPEPAAKGSAHYVGQASCTQCHADADAFWQTTGHAKAYKTLSDEFKEFNLDCVGCHVTGYNRPGGSTVTHADGLKNVQCEACHGPGSRHVESSGETELIRLSPAPDTCRSCHHTPHVADDWDVTQAWLQIIGPGHGEAAAAKAKQAEPTAK